MVAPSVIEKELKYKRPSEKVQLFRKRKTKRALMSDEARAEERFRQLLVEKGLLAEIKPLVALPEDDWIPLELKGKPLSQIVIEERR